MQQLKSALETKPALRITLVVALILLGALIVVPGPVWSSLTLKFTRYFGIHFLVLVAASIAAFVTWDRRWVYWSAIPIAGLIVVQIFGGLAQTHYAKQGQSEYDVFEDLARRTK